MIGNIELLGEYTDTRDNVNRTIFKSQDLNTRVYSLYYPHPSEGRTDINFLEFNKFYKKENYDEWFSRNIL